MTREGQGARNLSGAVSGGGSAAPESAHTEYASPFLHGEVVTMSEKVPVRMGKTGRELWLTVTKTYVLDAGETALLTAACRTLDEIDLLEVELSGSPATVKGSRGQPVPHPLLAELRAHRRTLSDLVGSLALPVGDETVGRVRSPRVASAARARWRNDRRLRVERGGDDGAAS